MGSGSRGLVRIIALASLVAVAACGPAKRGRMVGELERLGPNGRDVLVLGVDAPGFDDLPRERKILAYLLYRAAIAGNDIAYMQNHRYALELKQLLETIFLRSGGMREDLRDAIHDYLKYVWIHHGNYHHYTHAKFLPNELTPEGLREAARYALDHGASIMTMPGETLERKLERLEPFIFDPEFEPLSSIQSENGDIIAESAVNLYAPGVTSGDIEKLISYWKEKLNVRFTLVEGKVVPQIYKIGGLYSRELETVVHFLRLALPYAEGDEQRAGIESLIRYYETGDEAYYREHCIHWLRSSTSIDYVNGFVEQYLDPRGVIGAFEGNVSFAAGSEPVGLLAQNAAYFEKRMPWPDAYKREEVVAPVAEIVNVLVETGDAGPVSPAAYNLPNYNDIRRDYGSKNVILLNIEASRSRELLEREVEEFYLPRYRKQVVDDWIETVRPWEVYMHEIIGHGSGRPDPSLGDDPRVLLGKVYSSLEECRADLVALYHIADPKLPEIDAFPAEKQPEIVETTYISYLQGWFSHLDRVEGTEVREAHDRGSHLILMYLLENGGSPDKDFGVNLVRENGDYFVAIDDAAKVRAGVGELLSRLQTIKSTGDAEAAEELFSRFGTRVPPEWKENVVARREKLAIPKIKAFVFPRLEPVMENGRIVDVRISNDEDLTQQQLRFSRLQYSTEIDEN